MSRNSEQEVILPADLHARPAGQVARAAARFQSVVILSAQEKEADARSVLRVMGLGATGGSQVAIRAMGDDAAEAVRVIADLLKTFQ